LSAFTESDVEGAALAWLETTGWGVAHGPDIAPDMPAAKRRDHVEVVLAQRLRDALARLNPSLSHETLEEVFRNLTRPEDADLIQRNRALHRLLVDGVAVEYRLPAGQARDAEGGIRGAQARVLDLDDPGQNDWLVVNQFTVAENRHTRRPDVVVFVNGLPLGLVELKNAAAENATIWTAFQQLQTYKTDVLAGTRVFSGPGAVLVRFARIADPLLAKISAGEHESRTLAALRDALLPRLVSGELRVEDPARILGRVG
jgi:type I restriction enzyme R subunit